VNANPNHHVNANPNHQSPIRAAKAYSTGHLQSKGLGGRESGETLVELLVAVVILGLAAVAIVFGLLTAIMGSSEYRGLANIDSVLKTAAADATSQAEGTPGYFQCSPVWTGPTTWPGVDMTKFQLSPTVSSWDTVNAKAFTSCTPNAPLEITIQATQIQGDETDNITVIVDDPNAPKSSTSYSTGSQIQWAFQPGYYPTDNPNLQPGQVQAGTPFSVAVQVEDSNENRVLNDLSSITLQVTPPGSSVASPLACTAVESGGVITFSGCVLDTPAGPGWTVSTTTTANLAEAPSETFTVVPGPASQLVFNTQPTNTTGGVAFSPQPSVYVEDAWNNIVTSDNSKAVPGLTVTSGTLPSTAQVSCSGQHEASGLITFNGCAVNTAFGNATCSGACYELTASDPLDGIASSAPSSPFSIAVGPRYQLGFIQVPTGGAAAAAFAPQPEVAVQDQGGNTETSDSSSTVQLSLTPYLTANNSQQPLPSGAALTCTGTNASTGITSVTVSAGLAKFTNCSLNVLGDGYSLTASDSSVPTQAPYNPAISQPYFDITNAAAQLAFVTEPSSTATAAVPFSSQPVVAVEDASGNIVTAGASQVTLTASSGAGTFTCTAPVTTSSGLATFNGCAISLAGGPYTLTATDGTLTQATSTPITVSPGSPAQLVFNNPPASPKPTFTAGGVFTPQPQVSVEDASGNVVTSDSSTVTLTVAGQSLTCSGTGTSVAAVSGVATFQGCGGLTTAGNYTLVASDTEGVITLTHSLPFTVTGGPPVSISFSTAPGGTITGGSPFGTQPVVLLKDVYGNPASVAGSVSLQILPAGQPGSNTTGTGTLTCNPASNQAIVTNGVASFNGCQINTAATDYTLQAAYSTTSVSLSVNADIAVIPGPATSMSFSASPNTNPPASSGNIPTLPAGTNFATQPVVTLRDAGGNITINDTSSVTIAGPAGGGLHCANTTVAVNNGMATFSGCYMTKVGGPYTLTATDGSLPSATSAQFDISPGAPVSTGITVAAPTSVAAGSSFSVTVTVKDAYGNPIPGATVALSDSTGSLSCTPGSATTNASGVEQFTLCTVTVVPPSGTDTLTATASSASGAASGTTTMKVTAGGPANVAFSSPWSSGAPAQTAHTAFSSNVVVTVTDQYGNPVATGTTVTLSDASGTIGNCTLTGTTNATGQVTFSNCWVNKAGSDTLTATSGTATGTTPPFTVNTGAPSSVVVTPTPSPATAGSAFSVSVTVTDAGGNPVAGQTVTLTHSGTWTTACTVPNPATTGSNGIESFTGCVAKLATSYTITGKIGNGTTGTATLTVSPGAASTVTFNSAWNPPANQTAMVAIPNVAVTVDDAYGNAVANGTTVTLSDASGTIGANGSCTLAQTTTNGTVTFSGCLIKKAGTDSLTASAGTATGTTSNFTVSPGRPATVTLNSTWTGTVGAQTAGTAFANSVTATVVDAGGNPISGTPVVLTDASASLDGCTATGTNTASINTGATGQATFTGCYVTVAGGDSLSATATAGPAAASSSAFTVNPGAAAILAFTSSPYGSTSNTNFTVQPAVEAEDAYGNEVTSFSGNADKVTMSIATSAGTTGVGTLNTCTSTPASGTATFTGCKITTTTVGSFVLQASGGGVTGLSSSFPVGENTGTYLLFALSPAASQNAAAFSVEPTVQFENNHGALQNDNGTITLTISSGTGTLGSCTGPTSGGVANFSGCEITLGTAGQFTLKATATTPNGVVAGYSASFYIYK
jgi:type II secretory pathway pseudopilin PulG/protocatechuate 3,4-dioxygenase beta subunit